MQRKSALLITTLSLVLFYIPLLCMSNIYSIIPSIRSYCNTPLCFTLQKFATIESQKDDSNSLALVLQPGKHTLESQLILSDMHHVSLSTSSDTLETWIVCHGSSMLMLSNISHVDILRVNFLDCENITSVDVEMLKIQGCELIGRNISNAMFNFHSVEAVIESSSFNASFRNNENAKVNGAVACSSGSNNIKIESCRFTVQQGSAIIMLSELRSNNAIIIDNTIISNSTADDYALVWISNGKFNIENSVILHNSGKMIIYARNCMTNITNSTLESNSGRKCILCVTKSKIHLSDVKIPKNTGNPIIHFVKTGVNVTKRLLFSGNSGSFLTINSRVEFSGDVLFEKGTNNSVNDQLAIAQSTFTVIQSTISVRGVIKFSENNSTKFGGAIYASESKVTIYDNLLMENNAADKGGGAFCYLSTIICHGNCSFVRNKAFSCGGGIHAVSTAIMLSQSTLENHRDDNISMILQFINNRAEYGGAIYYETGSKLNCIVDEINQYAIKFIKNIANMHGGAIFVRDETYLSTCNSISNYHQTQTECFFQVQHNDVIGMNTEMKKYLSFVNNKALKGSVLYGGLIDRCTVSLRAEIYNKSNINALEYLRMVTTETVDPSVIASDAVRIEPCQERGDMLFSETVAVLKGEMFTISVRAVDQVNHTVNTSIRSFLPEDDILGEGQQLQHAYEQCTKLTFNISSPKDAVNLVLYADPGPCENKGLSHFDITVNFRDCKCLAGFRKLNVLEKCECELDPQLHSCITVVNSSLLKRTSNCWINTYTHNESSYLYIVHPNCPYDYCLSPESGIVNLNEPNGSDGQCNFNRFGLLCGQCKEGYSLSMGSSHCLECPKNWPGLAFANVLMGGINGVMLVVLLLLLNLTVASGTLNGMIFYANVVLINRSILLPFSGINIFSILVYALNTQIGIERCFWEGMTAYMKTWLIYLNPLYMIFLVISVIVISHYSSKCADVIGKRNPIACLATLILLSYTAFLRAVLETLSFAVINYPDGRQEIVWLPDASVKYFQGKHIPLLLTAIIVIVVGLTYTLLLFSWQWLQRTPNIRMLRWIRNTKLNLFIEAYHAPYNPKYRYWTGLLLLVRVVLDITVTLNISGDPQYVLFTTGILTAFLLILKAYLGEKIYKNWLLDYVECTCYVSLLIFILAIFKSYDKRELFASLSIGVIFVLFISTVVYHIHSTLSKSIKKYKRLCSFVGRLTKIIWKNSNDGRPLDDCHIQSVTKSMECTSTEVVLSEIRRDESESEKLMQETVNISSKFKGSEDSAYGSNSLRELLLHN